MKTLIGWMIPLAAMLIAAPVGRAAVDEGKADIVPWSGYWWPTHEGKLHAPGGPLDKYDRLTGKRAAAWEKDHHPPGPRVPRWYGYCHGWAAAALAEAEPRTPVTASSPGGAAVTCGVGDQKGLLTACHTRDIANMYGRRNNSPGPDDGTDFPPDELWRVLKLYVQQQGVPVVLDLDAGPEVWNHPVYAYQVDYNPAGPAEAYTAVMTVWLADDGVPPDFIGTRVAKQTYTFTFRMKDNAVVAGSARWTGPSEQNHPDFACYPLVAVPENPEVDPAAVRKLIGGGSPPPAAVRPGPAPGPRIEDPARPPQPPGAALEAQPVHRAGDRPVVLSPQELLAVVTNKKSAFLLDVTVDRFDGGKYQVGETFTVPGESEKDGYLYLFLLPPDGDLQVLFPLPGQDNRVHAKKAFKVPGEKDAVQFRLTGPPGGYRVKAVVTRQPLWLTGLTREGVDAGKFRWNPTCRTAVRQVVHEYLQKDTVRPERIGTIRPEEVLGAFAQDEVLFLVEPAEVKPKK